MTAPVIAAGVIAASQAAQADTDIFASSQLAQWALESAWGAHCPGNNPFGIKHLAGYGDQHFLSHEVVNGRSIALVETFAAFASIAQAFDVHARLIAKSPIYAPAMAALPNRDRFIALMSQHYATDPQYANKLNSVIRFGNLGRFDIPPFKGSAA